MWQTVPWIFSLDGTPGTRAPHIWVEYAGKRTSTLDLFGKNFVLIAGMEGDKWCEAAKKVAASVFVELVAYRAGPEGELLCPKGTWESLAGILGTGALLIRPDGFVAWRSWKQPVNVREKLEMMLLQALCR